MNDYLRPFRGRIDRRHIAPATIVIVGVGRVGGWLALELARLVPRRLILVDGDDLETSNLSGHPLPAEFVSWNKAVAMAEWLGREVPGIQNITAIPHFIDADTPDERVFADVIGPAAIVIVATDNLETQRRVAGLAREAEAPAIIPGIAADGSGRGEAFVSFSENEPCVECFDAFRPSGSPVRGAAAVALDAAPAVQLGFSLTLGVLDPTSREAELLTPLREGGPVPQLFRAWPPGAPELSHADDGRTEVPWRANCPGCGGRNPPPRPRRQPVRAAQPRRLPSPRRLSPTTVMGVYFVELLGLMIFTDATAGVVLSLMFASLMLGLGIWIGFAWRGRV